MGQIVCEPGKFGENSVILRKDPPNYTDKAVFKHLSEITSECDGICHSNIQYTLTRRKGPTFSTEQSMERAA